MHTVKKLQPTTTLKRKTGYREEEEEVTKARRRFVALSIEGLQREGVQEGSPTD